MTTALGALILAAMTCRSTWLYVWRGGLAPERIFSNCGMRVRRPPSACVLLP